METAREARQVASQQVSSGKRITRLSDDPAAALDALRARRELQRSEAYNRQAADADGWLTTYDTSLQTVADRLIRVRELALQGASAGATGGATSVTLTEEIASIRTELASLANQRYLGKPVFAGTAEPASVYSAAFTYQGDNGQFLRTIASGVTLQVNINGPSAFGADASPTQMFAVLQDLESKITAGDSAGLATAISNLDTARERIDTLRVQVGVKQNTVKSIQDQRANVETDLRAQLSIAEDVDMAQASIDLNAADLAYKATLSAAARLFQTSLVDFLR
jgi:flagellar hook-associated protein 3 FlgL